MEQRYQFSSVEEIREILQSLDMRRKRKPLTVIFVKGEKEEERENAYLDIVDCINRRRVDMLKYQGAWSGVTDITDVAAIVDIEKQNIPSRAFIDIVLCSRIRTKERSHWNRYGYLIITSNKSLEEIYKDSSEYHQWLIMDIKSKIIEVDI